MPTVGPSYAAAQTTSPTGGVVIAGELTNPANAVGSTEATYATTTGAVQGNYYGNLYTFGSAFSGIPAGSTIDTITVEVEHKSSNSAGVLYAYAMFSGGSLIEEISAVTLAATVDTILSVPFTLKPSLSQLQAADFGVRCAGRRNVSTARTYSLDWTRVTVTYTAPASATSLLPPMDIRTRSLVRR